MLTVDIVPYQDANHRNPVVMLWKTVFGYETAHNELMFVIDSKLAVQDRLFFVAVSESNVVGTSMAGYDGHRGWIYFVAVASSSQPAARDRHSTGSVRRSESERTRLSKINLQIAEGNEQVTGFYSALGYEVEPRVSMGKRLSDNIPSK